VLAGGGGTGQLNRFVDVISGWLLTHRLISLRTWPCSARRVVLSYFSTYKQGTSVPNNCPALSVPVRAAPPHEPPTSAWRSDSNPSAVNAGQTVAGPLDWRVNLR